MTQLAQLVADGSSLTTLVGAPTLASLGDLPGPYWLAPVGAIAALAMARVFSATVMKRSEGEEEQVRIAEAVRQGAMAYLYRQYKVVAIVFVVLIAVLGIMSFGLGLQPTLSMLGVPIAGLFSGLCGWFGMRMATNASARTAAAAKQSLNDGLTVAFRSGAVMGLNVVGFALLDVSAWFLVLNGFGESIGLTGDIRETTTIALSFAMGASTQALFARVGGGIYTKAADVGADLVGKVEAGIPEDDARNPATIADNVGDNVGDVAGMGADLYESYYGSILSTAALGAAAAFTVPALVGGEQAALALRMAVTPLALAGFGILASIVGIFAVRTKEGATFAQLLQALNRGVYLASALIILAAFGVPFLTLGGSAEAAEAGLRWFGVSGSIIAGLIAGLVIARATEFYTSYEYSPTKGISEQGHTGPATVIIAGIATGMKSTWIPILTVVVAVIAAFIFSNGGEHFLMGLYGVAIAAVGMLATLGITLATDAYGPIADNAGGNAEMSGQPPFVRHRTDMLDSLGNTTAAIGKGFAIGSAALTALALFAAYVQIVQTQLFRQADNYVATARYSAPAGPHAVYQGHHKFAIVVPGEGRPYVDGAMIVDHAQLMDTNFDEAIEPGTVMGVRALPRRGVSATTETTLNNARRFVLTAPSGGAFTGEIEVVGTRNGTIQDVLTYYDVTLVNPRVLGGIFMGVLLTFLFCAMTMQAVGRAAYRMMRECRRQFGIMRAALRSQGMDETKIADPENWPKRIKHEGRDYPDYETCVSIATAGAQREMVVPAILAILVPLAVGLVLGVGGVIGLLAGGLTSGFAVAVYMANAGGAWDNAKKLIESYGRVTADKLLDDPEVRGKLPASIADGLIARAEELRKQGKGAAYVYGKGSEDHKATVVGDTVGDPFKDTSGPSLNILVKLISIVSVVFAGVVVKFGPIIGSLLGLP